MKKSNLPKPITAYAVVSKNSPKLKLLDIYETDDVEVTAKEKIIKVLISAKE